MGSHDCTWSINQQFYPLCWALWTFTTLSSLTSHCGEIPPHLHPTWPQIPVSSCGGRWQAGALSALLSPVDRCSGIPHIILVASASQNLRCFLSPFPLLRDYDADPDAGRDAPRSGGCLTPVLLSHRDIQSPLITARILSASPSLGALELCQCRSSCSVEKDG